MRSIQKTWPAILVAAALAVAVPACGDDDAEQELNDAADTVEREGKEAGKDIERETRNERKDIGDKAEDVGKDAKREGEQAVD